MSDWVAVQDPGSGRTYYANMRTRETSWDVPADYVPEEPEAQYGGADPSAGDYGSFYAGGGQPAAGGMYGGGGAQPAAAGYYGAGAGGGYEAAAGYGAYAGGGSGYGAAAMGGGPAEAGYGAGDAYAGGGDAYAGGGDAYGAGDAYAGGYGAVEPEAVDSGAPRPGDAVLPTGSKWQVAHDPTSGRDYYYHTVTEETRWTKPEELEAAGAPMSGASAVIPAFAGEAEDQIQTAWDSSSSGEVEDSADDSWAKEESEEESSSEDGLATFSGAKKSAVVGASAVVTDPSSSDSEHKVESFAPIADDEDIVIEDDSDKYWILGETQADKYVMEEFARKNFQTEKHKKGLLKKRSVEELLAWAPYKKMNNALTRMDAKLNTQARQVWKNLCSYMGDRKSGKGDEGHIDKLLRFALKAPEELRDEIYCQLVKQTTRNPKEASLMKGWNMMCLCASTFPPADEFACYLAVYLFMRTREAGKVGQKAEFALRALDRSMEVGQRRCQPSPEEAKRIEQMQPVDIRVYFLDGTFRNLKVSSQTRAAQVEETLAKAFGMSHAESFGLFEVEDPRPGWEEPVYAKREPMTSQQKIDNLVVMPMDRELELNERIMDVVSSWQRSAKKKERFIRFCYKCKVYSKAQESQYTRYAWRIAFITSVWHVIHGLYLVENEALILRLAALQLQGQNGAREDGFYETGVIVAQVENFVPWTVRRKYPSAAELEKLILEKHISYRHLDKVDAYRKYIEMLRKEAAVDHFGCAFFRCVRVSRMKKSKVDRDDLVIGLSEHGMILCKPRTMEVYERYKMEEILTYGFRNNAFLVVAGNLMTQKKFQFATMLGKQMNDLLAAHIDLRVQQAEIQGYKLQQT